MPYSTQADFVELYVVDAVDEDVDRVLDLENPPPSEGAQLPCPAAIEFMADIHEARGKEGITEAVKVRPFLMFVPYSPASCVCHCHQLWRSLAHTHDTIRKRYVVKICGATAHRIKLVTRTGIGNSEFETLYRTLARPEATTTLMAREVKICIIILVRPQRTRPSFLVLFIWPWS